MDGLGLAALAAVSAEWLVVGWVSGVGWPATGGDWWAPRWGLRLLVGAVLIACAQLLLALTSLGFRNPAVLISNAIPC